MKEPMTDDVLPKNLPKNLPETLDVTGHKCPIPVLRLRRRLERLRAGTILKLMATDPMTQIDVPHFCQESHHVLVDMTEENGILLFEIRKSDGTESDL